MNDAAKLIEVIRILLAQLEALIESVPQYVREDDRTESLSNQVAAYQTKLARVKNVLRKHQEHEKRTREIEKQNRLNSRRQ